MISGSHAYSAGVVDPVEQHFDVARREIFIDGSPGAPPMAVVVDDDDPTSLKARKRCRSSCWVEAYQSVSKRSRAIALGTVPGIVCSTGPRT